MDAENILYTFIIFSENTAGILNEITSVFSRRQVNIESLNTSASGVEGLHRYTITCCTNQQTATLISKQIEKKIGVVKSDFYSSDQDVFFDEVALYKISSEKLLTDPMISKAIRRTGGRVLEVNTVYTLVSLSGKPEEIKNFYATLTKYDCILQFVRSGPIAITRSKREQLAEYLEERKKSYQLAQKEEK